LTQPAQSVVVDHSRQGIGGSMPVDTTGWVMGFRVNHNETLVRTRARRRKGR
jgi:hypothetical protein